MDDEDQDRVKIYQMDDEGVWLDQGTGRVSLSDSLMVVTSEVEPPTVMLKCMIRNIEFSRQQESLLMWTENNKELALSFQIQEKCDQIWDEIVEVQKKYTEFVEDLPKPSTSNLDALEKIFVLGKGQREFFLDKLENSEFISDLMLVYKELLNECAGGVSIEDIDQDPTGSEKIKEIKQKFCQLSIVVKYLVFLNSETILNRIFHLDFLTMLEILEYDQEYSHSDFSKMFQQQNLKTIFDIDDEDLLNLMLDTQKAMFIKDVVLARALEDSTFLFLTSYISKNQALIVNYFISHPELLQKLMEICKYNDGLEEIDERKAIDGFSMLNELLTLSKACEKDEQQNLYAQLTNNQIFTVIHSHLSFPNAKVALKTCILTVLFKIVEYSNNSYREFLLKSDNFKHLTNIYLSENDDCLQYHWFEIFKSLLTTSQQSNSFSSYETLFIAFVYGGPILDFFRPILEYQKGNSNSSSILVSLELVLYTVENHSAHLRKLMLEHDIFEALIQVLNSPSVHLQSLVCKIFRFVLILNDDYYNSLLVKHSIPKLLLREYLRKNCSDNMNNVKSVIVPFVSHCRNLFEKVDSTTIFKDLVLKFEQFTDSSVPYDVDAMDVDIVKSGDGYSKTDYKEELYFENDDEEIPPAVPKSERRPSPPLDFIKAGTLPGSEPSNVVESTKPNDIDFNPTSAGSDEEDSFIHAKIVKKKPVIGIVTKKRKK